MTGVELMLAALCLTCGTDNDTFNQYPENLILLNDNYDAVTHIKGMEDLNPAEQEGFIETLHALDVKQQILKKLQDWVNGRHLKIATLEDFPLSYTAANEKGMRVGLGVAFQLVDFLKEKFNFTYEVIVPESNIFGSTEDFTGSLLELLNHSRVDMAAAFLPFLSEQRGFIYYSAAVLDEGEWIMVMRRPSESATGTGLLAPFEFEVWILILISLLVVGPIIYFLIILRNRLTGDVEQKPYSLGHCAWFVYGALMKQGSILSPIADSTRLLFATWWIFITILTSFYTANLTAFLTLSKFTLPFNTVDDILRNNKHFVTMRGGGVEYAIKLMNESLYMLHKMTMNNRAVFTANSNDTNNLISYVEKQGYVFIRDRPAIVHVLYTDYRYRRIQSPIEKLHCPFAESKIPFLKKRRSFAYPMGTNLSELFDWELMHLVEAGIIKHLLNKDLPNAEICPQNLGGTERQLRNGDLIMTYFIIAAGFATSTVIFTTELIFRCINQRKKSSLHSVQYPNQTPKDKELMYDNKNLLKSMSYKGLQPTDTQITPPPPYTIYHKGGDHENLSKNNNNNKTWSPIQNRVRNGFSVLRTVQPPQFGRPNFQTDSSGLRRTINGREYMMYRTLDGYTQLVPLRAPSATLFEYTYTE